MNMSTPSPRRVWLAPIGLAALTAVSTASWAGLARLGLDVGPAPAAIHGHLMVLGFLGTVIATERAVGLRRTWPWLAPGLSVGAVVALLTGNVMAGMILLTAAGLVLTAVYVAALVISGREAHLVVMGLGAVSWVVAAAGLAAGRSVHSMVPALAGFLVLTICGERLELSRMARPRSPAWRSTFIATAGVVWVGALVGLVDAGVSARVTGVGIVALGVTSAIGDVARRTIRMGAVTRFMAAALLIGYAWLVIGGATWVIAGIHPGTPSYDFALHIIFIGFVLSMIFAHAAVIVPAVLRVDLPYHPSWWVALAVLHLSLTARVVGGLIGSTPVKNWGGTTNVVALALFIVLAASSAIRASRARRRAA